MTGLALAIRLDHRIMRPRYPMLLLLLVIGVTVGSLSTTPSVPILLVTVITAPVGGSYFTVYETNRLDHLYGTLPLRRTAAEVGIYAHTFILVAVNGLLASVASWWISHLQHGDVSGWATTITFALSLLAACVYIGLLFPLYLNVPFSKIYILTNVPFYLLAVGLVYLIKRTTLLTHLSGLGSFYHDHPGWASALTIVTGLALLAVSWLIGHTTAAARRRS